MRALALIASYGMQSVWRSSLDTTIIFLKGCEAWALSIKIRAIDDVYTCMLRVARNVSWEDQMKNTELYGDLPRLFDMIRQRRMRLAGHCVRHQELVACDLVLWKPT